MRTGPKLLIILIMMISQGCYLANSLIYQYPDFKDAERFASVQIDGSTQHFSFIQNSTDATSRFGDEIIIDDFTFNGVDRRSLTQTLENHKTRAFLLIRNDTILYENYFGQGDKNNFFPSFSIAKSFVSATLGIAIEEGYISLEDSIRDYIPELDEELTGIKIKHLLHHTSGIKGATVIDAKIYYGRSIIQSFKNITMENEAGVNQAYLNINTQLLSIAIERAVGEDFSNYFEQKLWGKIGTESNAYWNTDKKNTVKGFCCLNAKARDFAKFGRLYLNKGKFKSDQVVPLSWIDYSIQRDSTAGKSYGYNASWYIGLKEYGDFMAVGLYKQFIYIHPGKNVLIVMFNEREKKVLEERVNYFMVFRQIVDQL